MTSHSLDVVLRDLRNKRGLDRVIVALTDRRSMMPVKELLELRLDGVRVEDGTSLIEKVSGQVEVDELHPSWIIFRDGFRLGRMHWFARRIVSVALALTLSIITLPFVPLIALLIKLGSRGPVPLPAEARRPPRPGFHCYKSDHAFRCRS